MSGRNSEIAKLYREGKTLEELSSDFGITRSRIQQIIHKEIGKEVLNNFGISITSNEDRKLLRAAVKEEIAQIVEGREKEWQTQKTDEIRNRIKAKLDQVPNLSSFVTLSSLSRTVGEEVEDLKHYFPEITKKILQTAKRKWSRNYTKCRNCGTTTVKHVSHGLCENCYPKSEIYKEMQRGSRLRNYEKWKTRLKEYAQSYKNRPYVKEKMRQKNDIKFFGGNRIKALVRDGFRCQICGRTQEQSLEELGRDLFVKHLKGPENHELENLVTVCQKCHFKQFIRKNPIPNIPKSNPIKIVDGQDRYSAIVGLVSNAFGVSQNNILSTSRRKDFVMPRHVAMYLLRKVYNYSYPQIAMVFNRDHTSVMHAEKRISEYASKDPKFKLELEDLEKEFNQNK